MGLGGGSDGGRPGIPGAGPQRTGIPGGSASSSSLLIAVPPAGDELGAGLEQQAVDLPAALQPLPQFGDKTARHMLAAPPPGVVGVDVDEAWMLAPLRAGLAARTRAGLPDFGHRSAGGGQKVVDFFTKRFFHGAPRLSNAKYILKRIYFKIQARILKKLKVKETKTGVFANSGRICPHMSCGKRGLALRRRLVPRDAGGVGGGNHNIHHPLPGDGYA